MPPSMRCLLTITSLSKRVPSVKFSDSNFASSFWTISFMSFSADTIFAAISRLCCSIFVDSVVVVVYKRASSFSIFSSCARMSL